MDPSVFLLFQLVESFHASFLIVKAPKSPLSVSHRLHSTLALGIIAAAITAKQTGAAANWIRYAGKLGQVGGWGGGGGGGGVMKQRLQRREKASEGAQEIRHREISVAPPDSRPQVGDTGRRNEELRASTSGRTNPAPRRGTGGTGGGRGGERISALMATHASKPQLTTTQISRLCNRGGGGGGGATFGGTTFMLMPLLGGRRGGPLQPGSRPERRSLSVPASPGTRAPQLLLSFSSNDGAGGGGGGRVICQNCLLVRFAPV